MGTRQLPSSDDSDNTFSGTHRARTEIMINQATLGCLTVHNSLPLLQFFLYLNLSLTSAPQRCTEVHTLSLPEVCSCHIIHLCLLASLISLFGVLGK
jgi:hypothetical protein